MSTRPTPDPQVENALLELVDVGQIFRRTGSGRGTVALDHVSLALAPGEVTALVGESGSGKSTIGLIAAGLLRPTSGKVLYQGREIRYSRAGLRSHHRWVQLIFQNPYTSLNPVHTIRHHLERPLKIHRAVGSAKDLDEAIAVLLSSVGLVPPGELAAKYPHQLSGGQRQRVGIARALATRPTLIVADEPTSMLDVSLRLDMLNLLLDLKDQYATSYLFITHDLASAHYVADRVAVLFRGNVVEIGRASDVVSWPKHPYTQLLLRAISGSVDEDSAPTGPAPDFNERTGCLFRYRCPSRHATCEAVSPPLIGLADGTQVACHLYKEDGESRSHDG